jgi:hypothetical protein
MGFEVLLGSDSNAARLSQRLFEYDALNGKKIINKKVNTKHFILCLLKLNPKINS